MLDQINDPKVKRVLTLPGDSGAAWQQDLARFKSGDASLDRRTAGEAAIKAIQRLLIFLGYSTSSTGAFGIDGDFGRGTNRAVAQFMFDHGLSSTVKRSQLCYACNWQNAKTLITAIPDVRLTLPVLDKMLSEAKRMIQNNEVMCGNYDEALFHLDRVHQRIGFSCKQILDKYGMLVQRALDSVKRETGKTIHTEWVLAIIKQETSGIVRPRFEQHWLSKLNASSPSTDLSELRFRAMSFGLGQIMGFNHMAVGATSAHAMFVSPISEQVMFVIRYLMPKASTLANKRPGDAEFRTIARFYNGPGYEKHHYHESLGRWYREFQSIM